MRVRQRVLALGVVAATGVSAGLWSSSSAATVPPDLEELARDAVVEDSEHAAAAIEALRARGPVGHAALMEVHAEAISGLRRRPPRTPDAAVRRLRHAIDRVSGQRDGHASGLYWHTDLGAARQESARTGRPVLSLRLLGRLDEELSCANSRFFRVVLYSDPAVAEHLQEHFVLHWSSERPAPRIEIDMGDGRRIVRTITGNSLHYVLDAEGRPVDAIVGLYSPVGFLRALEEASLTHRSCASGDRHQCLANAHRARLEAQRRAWASLREREPRLPDWDAAIASLPGAPSVAAPSATVAMRLTVSKAFVETPMLDLLGGRRGAAPPPEPDWARAAVLGGWGGVAPLSASSRNLLRLKTGVDDVDAMARRLAEMASGDGARNELLFRRRIRQWYVADEVGDDFEAMNRRVYRELMLTPADDPWLGLRAADLYDGVDVEIDRPGR